MPLGEEGPMSILSAQTNDSDWSDINTDDEDSENPGQKLKIDLDENCVSADSRDERTNDLSFSNPSTATPSTSSKKTKSLKSLKKMTNRRRQHSKIRKSIASIDSVPPEIMSVTDAEKFQTRLDAAAKQLKFNRRQVKSVIRTLVKSPDLYNLILVKAGERKELDPSAGVEPRLTRKVAKEVVETGGSLNWFLDKVSKTPGKPQTDESAALLNVEFPDDESDQEYDPFKDPEAVEALSDDDSVATGTPNSSIISQDTISTPVSGGHILQPTEGSSLSTERHVTFKRPLEASRVSRSLFFDNVFNENDHPSTSPRLTRSKGSLKQVTIEELESQFVPCDITPDMYDNDVDDYTLFLAETFGQPPIPEPVQDLEVETDPDFVYQESEELIDIPDEFVHNRSTKISQKEVDELMKELFEAYDLGNAEASAKKVKKYVSEYQQENTTTTTESRIEPVFSFSKDQANLMQQQIRQHIQLLTQSGLLSAGSNELLYVHQDSRNMLSELMSTSFLKPFSVFAQDNLFTSINFLNEWGEECPVEAEQKKALKKFELSSRLMNRMGDSNIFIYPNLLPTRGFGLETRGKSFWVEPEDYLIAIGLERFIAETTKPEKHVTLVRNGAMFIVNQGIVKNKTVEHVRVRIKNKRCTIRKSSQCEAIDYFIKFNQAPRISHTELQHYDHSAVVCPRFADPSKLPHNWKIFFNMLVPDGKAPKHEKIVKSPKPAFFGQSKCSPIRPQPTTSGTSIVETQQFQFLKTTKPHAGLYSRSPLKKERDRLLKKYSPMKRKLGKLSRGLEFTNEENFTEHPLNHFFLNDFSINQEGSKQIQIAPRLSPSAIISTAIHDNQIDQHFVDSPRPGQHDDVPMPEHRDCLEGVQECIPVENDQGDFDFTNTNNLPQGAKRRTKQIREAEMTLQLLEKESTSDCAYRREQEALELVITAKDILPHEKIAEFFQKIIAFKNDSIQAFMVLHPLCEGHPTLQEMLLDILTPTDALKLGHEISAQHELRQQMKSFFRKLRIFYANQPFIRTRILKEISTTLSEPHVTLEDLKNFAAKNFKSNQHLHDCFVSMFPKMPYPESLLPEAEVIDLSDEEDDDEDVPMDGSERLTLASMADDNAYGGENCPCLCHVQPNSPHCIHCSIKFKNGRVFIREGKSLRRVRLPLPMFAPRAS